MKSMKAHTACLICLTDFIDHSLVLQHLKKMKELLISLEIIVQKVIYLNLNHES